MREQQGDGTCEIWPENKKALDVFLRCGESWSIVVVGERVVYQGIRAESIEAAMRVSGVHGKQREVTFDDVRHMSLAALEILNG